MKKLLLIAALILPVFISCQKQEIVTKIVNYKVQNRTASSVSAVAYIVIPSVEGATFSYTLDPSEWAADDMRNIRETRPLTDTKQIVMQFDNLKPSSDYYSRIFLTVNGNIYTSKTIRLSTTAKTPAYIE